MLKTNSFFNCSFNKLKMFISVWQTLLIAKNSAKGMATISKSRTKNDKIKDLQKIIMTSLR